MLKRFTEIWPVGVLMSSIGFSVAAGEVNLASAQYGMILDGSDSIANYAFQSGNAFDGKPETAWVTGNDMNTHWMIAHWRQRTVMLSGFEIDFTPIDYTWRTHGQLFNNEIPELRRGRTVVPHEITVSVITAGGCLDKIKLPVRGDIISHYFAAPIDGVRQLKISFDSTEDGTYAIRELKISGRAPADSKSFKPQFSAAGGGWIWGGIDPKVPSREITKWYFRRVFETGIDEIDRAVLTFSAYNRGVFYLNGQEVARVRESGYGMLPVLTRTEIPGTLLHSGKNLIALSGEKIDHAVGAHGVIFQLAVRYKSGRVQYIGSDTGSRYSESAPEGWNSNLNGFPDWKPARLLASGNNFGETLWGLDYSLPFFSDRVSVSGIELSPPVPKAGDTYRLTVTFNAAEPLSADYGVLAEFGEQPLLYPTGGVMTLGESFLSPAEGLKAGFKGTCQRTLHGIWPRGISARVPMRLTLSNGKQQAEIMADGIGENSAFPVPGKLHHVLGVPEVEFADRDFPQVSTQAGRLVVDGKPVAPVLYASSLLTPERFADFLDSDSIRIFRVQAPIGACLLTGGEETGEDSYNKIFMAALERTIMPVCRMSADAKFILLLNVDFPNDWNLRHPSAQIQLGDGSTHIALPSAPDLSFVRESVSSALVREKLYNDLKRFVTELRRQPYANSILGILIFHGRAGENNWGLDINVSKNEQGQTVIRDRDTMLIGDFSLDGRRDLADYLRETYGTDAAWAAAWKISAPDAKIDDVLDLGKWPNERFQKELAWRDRPADRFMFRDGIGEGRLAEDFFKNMNFQRARFYLTAARAIKEASDNRLLVGGFIGYTVPTLTNSPPGLAQHTGHLMTGMIRESEDFDFIGSPHFYHMRRMGDPIMPMGTTDSMRLYDKLFINEFDSRTYLSPIPPKTFSQWETLNQLRKEFGYALIKNQAYWLLEFPYALSGLRGNAWFSDPAIIHDQAVARKTYQEHVTSSPPEKAGAEVAVFLSEHAPLYLDVHAPANTVHSNLINVLLPKFTMTGTPFDLYALEDLPRLTRENLHKKYRLMVFLNAFHLDSGMRDIIHENLKSDGRTLLFFYAPGYQGEGFDENSSLSLAGIENITGMAQMEKSARSSLIGLELLPGAFPGHPPTVHDAKGWWEGLQTRFYGNGIGPVFYLKPASGAAWRPLAYLRLNGQAERDKIALAELAAPDYRVIYSTVPDLPTDLVSTLVRSSGVHCYVEPGTVVYANHYFVCVNNGVNARPITIKLPRKASWTEVFDGKTYAADTDTLTIDFKRGETKLFKLTYP